MVLVLVNDSFCCDSYVLVLVGVVVLVCVFFDYELLVFDFLVELKVWNSVEVFVEVL